jgi:hypothetical protein
LYRVAPEPRRSRTIHEGHEVLLLDRLQARNPRHLAESGERIAVAERALNRLAGAARLCQSGALCDASGGTYAMKPE